MSYVEVGLADLSPPGIALVDGNDSMDVFLAQRTSGGINRPVLMFQTGEVGEAALEVGMVSPPDKNVFAVGMATGRKLHYLPREKTLATGDSILGYPLVVLACEADYCFLLGLSTDENRVPIGLVPIPGGEQIPSSVSNDICAMDADTVCVAGSGIKCFDSSAWTETVDEKSGIFNAIECAPDADPDAAFPAAAAVGDSGLVQRLSRDGTWENVITETGVDFTSVSITPGILVAGGGGGLYFGDEKHAISCTMPGETIAAVSVFTTSDPFLSGRMSRITALGAAGERYEIWKGPSDTALNICTDSSGVEGTPFLLKVAPDDGSSIIKSYALTPDTLYVRTELVIGI